MARSRRSGSAPRPASRPAAAMPPRQQSAPPPATHAPAPQPAMQQGGGGGMMGGMMGMIGQGLAFGTGSAVAHRAVDAVVGPRTVTHEHVPAADPATAAAAPAAAPASEACAIHSKAFSECVQSNTSDISRCQFYVDLLNDCKRQQGLMA